jgi:hypothetical protein
MTPKENQAIDLLEDATAESFAAWLARHPTVEVISRLTHLFCACSLQRARQKDRELSLAARSSRVVPWNLPAS